MLGKLAVRNVRRQIGNYLIYFITVSLTVALMFAFNSVVYSPQLQQAADAMDELKTGLTAITVFISLIVAFVLGYATSFMLRLRKREFGTYLTLGMTRRNILALFVLETLILGAAALAAGIVLGLFVYQGLMLLLVRLLEMEFTIAAYSLQGLLLTVVLVAAMFALASLTSALYLRRATVYQLLHGDRVVEKNVRHPGLWLAVTLVSLAAAVGSCVYFGLDTHAALTSGGGSGGSMLLSLLVLAVSLVTFHIGLARSLASLLLKSERFCSRGANTFVLRQLSGKLSANSVMAGALAFLLAFAVIGANFSFVQKIMVDATLDRSYPFDALLLQEPDETPSLDPAEAEEILASYAAIEDKYVYRIYDTGESALYSRTPYHGEGYGGLTDAVVAESDFNRLLQLVGEEPVELNGGYLLLSQVAQVFGADFSQTRLTLGGREYPFAGKRNDLPRLCYFYLLAVVPDEAVAGLPLALEGTAYGLADTPFDAEALRSDLSYLYTTPNGQYQYLRCDYDIREYGRLSLNANAAVFILGALYTAVVFVCMVMAILALKTLSGLAEDRRRYTVLMRLGADRRTRCRALLRQTFSFFLLPFALPLLLSIPTAIVCADIMNLSGYADLARQVPICTLAVAAVMILLYLLYFTATYLLARRAVVDAE